MIQKLIIALAFLCTAACSPQEMQVVEIPTLMVLPTLTLTPAPSETPTQIPTAADTLTPTLTLTPSRTPTETPSPTLTPSNTPIPSPTPDCPAAAWWNEASDIVIQFFDTAEVAGMTSRMSLSPIILELQQTRRSLERLDTPSCMQNVADELGEGMAFAVDGYNQFLGEISWTSIVRLDQATFHFYSAAQRLKELGLRVDPLLEDTSLIWNGTTSQVMTLGSAEALAGCDTGQVNSWAAFLDSVLDNVSSAEADLSSLSGKWNVLFDRILREDYPSCTTEARFYLLAAIDTVIASVDAWNNGDYESGVTYRLALTDYTSVIEEAVDRIQPGVGGVPT